MLIRSGMFLQDRYEILEKIGSGGMSDVYKAKCHKLNRLVAIKVLKEEFSNDVGFVGKFKMEAQAAARLSHPNIVNVFDVVDDESLHYIVMELIEGITLKAYIAKKGRLDMKEAIGIAIQVAQGIAAAHEQNIIHRDIKPQNIIIAKDGKVKVADFGIARAVSSQTLSATAMGSVHYISPEQARGGYSDVRSDIYSLGITLFEMVTGVVPFAGDNTVAVALAHLEDPIPAPRTYNPQITSAVQDIILKCTAKKPEHRYNSAAEVIQDLRKAMVNPDGGFVEGPAAVQDSQTIIISPPELEQIRGGRKPQNGNRKPSADYFTESGYKKPENVQKRVKKEPEPEEDINPKIERLMTIAGVVVAVIIVVALLVIFAKIGGLFRSDAPVGVTNASEEETTNDKQVAMPDVLGLSEDMARDKLKDSSLDMKISTYQFSDTIEAGDVISQNPEEGKVVDKYSTVTVIISKGSETKEIDLTILGLTNMTAEAAKTLLEKKGLIVQTETQSSQSVVEGRVISFSPQTVQEGGVVKIIFSSGPETPTTVLVPNLIGQSEEKAGALLAEAGLAEGTVTSVFSDTVAAGKVVSQELEAGSEVDPGTEVGYKLSKGQAEQIKYKYLASIDKSYPLQNVIGPGSSSTELHIKVRLKQTVNGKAEYRDLIDTVTVRGDQVLPIKIDNIEGANGVTSGEVEIVNVDTGEVLNSYPLTFIPVPQS